MFAEVLATITTRSLVGAIGRRIPTRISSVRTVNFGLARMSHGSSSFISSIGLYNYQIPNGSIRLFLAIDRSIGFFRLLKNKYIMDFQSLFFVFVPDELQAQRRSSLEGPMSSDPRESILPRSSGFMVWAIMVLGDEDADDNRLLSFSSSSVHVIIIIIYF